MHLMQTAAKEKQKVKETYDIENKKQKTEVNPTISIRT